MTTPDRRRASMGMFDRRIFLITTAALAVTRRANAQSQSHNARIGFLATTDLTRTPSLDAFREGLREHGWVGGKNLRIEYRWAEGGFDPQHDLAADLVRLKVDLISTWGSPATAAAKRAASTIRRKPRAARGQPHRHEQLCSRSEREECADGQRDGPTHAPARHCAQSGRSECAVAAAGGGVGSTCSRLGAPCVRSARTRRFQLRLRGHDEGECRGASTVCRRSTIISSVRGEALCRRVLSLGHPISRSALLPRRRCRARGLFTSTPHLLHEGTREQYLSGYARSHSTSAGCDTSAAKRSGAWRSTPTATSATSRAHSPTVLSTALPKRRSKWVPLTCGRAQAVLALGHGRIGLPILELASRYGVG